MIHVIWYDFWCIVYSHQHDVGPLLFFQLNAAEYINCLKIYRLHKKCIELQCSLWCPFYEKKKNVGLEIAMYKVERHIFAINIWGICLCFLYCLLFWLLLLLLLSLLYSPCSCAHTKYKNYICVKFKMLIELDIWNSMF